MNQKQLDALRTWYKGVTEAPGVLDLAGEFAKLVEFCEQCEHETASTILSDLRGWSEEHEFSGTIIADALEHHLSRLKDQYVCEPAWQANHPKPFPAPIFLGDPGTPMTYVPNAVRPIVLPEGEGIACIDEFDKAKTEDEVRRDERKLMAAELNKRWGDKWFHLPDFPWPVILAADAWVVTDQAAGLKPIPAKGEVERETYLKRVLGKLGRQNYPRYQAAITLSVKLAFDSQREALDRINVFFSDAVYDWTNQGGFARVRLTSETGPIPISPSLITYHERDNNRHQFEMRAMHHRWYEAKHPWKFGLDYYTEMVGEHVEALLMDETDWRVGRPLPLFEPREDDDEDDDFNEECFFLDNEAPQEDGGF